MPHRDVIAVVAIHRQGNTHQVGLHFVQTSRFGIEGDDLSGVQHLDQFI